MIQRIERKDRRIIREMKQEEDRISIILMVTVVQCNVCMIGSMSMENAR
jgi:hypothetical protein